MFVSQIGVCGRAQWACAGCKRASRTKLGRCVQHKMMLSATSNSAGSARPCRRRRCDNVKLAFGVRQHPRQMTSWAATKQQRFQCRGCVVVTPRRTSWLGLSLPARQSAMLQNIVAVYAPSDTAVRDAMTVSLRSVVSCLPTHLRFCKDNTGLNWCNMRSRSRSAKLAA